MGHGSWLFGSKRRSSGPVHSNTIHFEMRRRRIRSQCHRLSLLFLNLTNRLIRFPVGKPSIRSVCKSLLQQAIKLLHLSQMHLIRQEQKHRISKSKDPCCILYSFSSPAANAQSLPPLPNTQFLFRKFGTRGAKPNHGLFQESVTSALTGSFPSAPFGFFLLFFTRFEFNLIWVFFIFALESNFHAQLVMFNHYYAVLRSLLELKICNRSL